MPYLLKDSNDNNDEKIHTPTKNAGRSWLPLSEYCTMEAFEMLVSKFAISGAMYCVAASQEWTYSPVYKKPPVAIVTFRTGCP